MGSKNKNKVETMTNYAPKPQPKKQNKKTLKLTVGKPTIKETKKGFMINIPVTPKHLNK